METLHFCVSGIYYNEYIGICRSNTRIDTGYIGWPFSLGEGIIHPSVVFDIGVHDISVARRLQRDIIVLLEYISIVRSGEFIPSPDVASINEQNSSRQPPQGIRIGRGCRARIFEMRAIFVHDVARRCIFCLVDIFFIVPYVRTAGNY